MNSLTNFFNSCLLLVCLSSISSCTITRTPGFYSGYKRLPADQKKRIITVNDSDKLPKLIDSNTYAITATHMMQVIKKRAPCIIYLWTAHCSGSACMPIHSFQEFCKTIGYNSVIYSEYYAFEQLSNQGVTPSNVFAINNQHYKTDYCNKYVRRFQESLFHLFGEEFNAKYHHKYLYYDGKKLTHIKPTNIDKYPWQ